MTDEYYPLGLSPEERAVLSALYRSRGHWADAPRPAMLAALTSLADRGLVYRGPTGGWWLTGDGQAVVEAAE